MSPKLKAFIQAWLITTLGALCAAYVVEGIRYDTVEALLVATLLLGILNAVVRPFLMLLSLPLLLLTLGMFTLVINAGLLYFVGKVVHGFHVYTFWAACKGALLMALISLVLNSMAGGVRANVNANFSVKRGGSAPPPAAPPMPGKGPIIDV